MKIVIGCDHAGFDYKDPVIKLLKEELHHEVIDVGCPSKERVDYPDFGEAAARVVASGQADFGILICGSGIGIGIAANKVNGIRCALCHDHLTAKLCRNHNNANMISFGARLIGLDTAFDIVRTFLSEPFEGGRHVQRVEKISAIEAKESSNNK